MSYSVPNFNLLLQGWAWGNTPGGGGADIFDVPAQLYIESKQGGLPVNPEVGSPEAPTLIMRIPLAYAALVSGIGIWDVDGGLNNLYLVYFSEVMHRGFTNAYLAHFVQQCDAGGAPIRRGIP